MVTKYLTWNTCMFDKWRKMSTPLVTESSYVLVLSSDKCSVQMTNNSYSTVTTSALLRFSSIWPSFFFWNTLDFNAILEYWNKISVRLFCISVSCKYFKKQSFRPSNSSIDLLRCFNLSGITGGRTMQYLTQVSFS